MSERECRTTLPRAYPRPFECAVGYLGRVYGIEAIEYPRPSRGLLIAAGTGLMLSLMDACPQLRWCVDADGFTPEQQTRMAPWLACANNVTDLIVVAGWYCSTNPVPLSIAVRRLNWRRVLCYVQCRGVGDDPFDDMRTSHSLDELISHIHLFPNLPWMPKAADDVVSGQAAPA